MTKPDKTKDRSRWGSSEIDLPALFEPNEEERNTERYRARIGRPGEFPFTRGVYSTMYRGRRWTMRQYSGFGSAEETNQRYRYLLSQGTTGLSVAFDLPTQMGRDSDDAVARGEVGRVGVAIDSIEDMERLFEAIPLESVSTSMTINATAHVLLALYLVLAKRRGVAWSRLKGTVQNDILKEYIARGTYIYPPKPALRIVTDIIEFCKDQVPNWNSISVSGYHIREAGSTAVQEVAFTLADGIAYVEQVLARGLPIDSFAPRLAFFFNCHNNFLEEVAKFRAARRMWAVIMRDRFGAKDPSSMMLRFHTQTAGSSLLAQQPKVNVVRTTLQAFAAVCGGTQSLHTNGYDEALALPSEESALLALRTQQVIACESGVVDVIDPFAGSYAVEKLTDEIERLAFGYIARIDAMGGMLAAINSGFPQAEIDASAYRYQQGIERSELEIVGLNVFSEQEESDQKKGGDAEGAARIQGSILRIDPAIEQRQVERLRQFRAARVAEIVGEELRKVRSAAVEGRNIVPVVCEAVDGGATLGEISNELREVFGQHS